jgi:hypothetical protein
MQVNWSQSVDSGGRARLTLQLESGFLLQALKVAGSLDMMPTHIHHPYRMHFNSAQSWLKEFQAAFEQFQHKPHRGSLRWLARCTEGLRFNPHPDRVDIEHWYEGRTTLLFALELPEHESAYQFLRELQSKVREDVIANGNADFDDEFAGKGKYTRSQIFNTTHFLNPIDSSSYAVSNILPVEIRRRLGLKL